MMENSLAIMLHSELCRSEKLFHSVLELAYSISPGDVSLHKIVICCIITHRILQCLGKQNTEHKW